MSNQTVSPRSDPPSSAGTTADEDAGRLVNASTGRLVAVVLMLVLFSEVVPFQYTMIGVITPKIGAAFPASGNSTSWVLTITGVVGGASMALVGKLADLVGKKKILLCLTLFFLAGSVIGALTTNWALFLVARGLQALSLGISAVAMSAVRDLMPRRWIPVCVGWLATGSGFAGIAAPLVGGVLTDHYSWRAIFWFLVIYTAVTIPLFAVIVPESPVRVKQRFDWLGGTLFGVGLGGTLIYLSEGANWGWTDMGCVAYLLGGLAALVAFVLWENHTPESPGRRSLQTIYII